MVDLRRALPRARPFHARLPIQPKNRRRLLQPSPHLLRPTRPRRRSPHHQPPSHPPVRLHLDRQHRPRPRPGLRPKIYRRPPAHPPRAIRKNLRVNSPFALKANHKLIRCALDISGFSEPFTSYPSACAHSAQAFIQRRQLSTPFVVDCFWGRTTLLPTQAASETPRIAPATPRSPRAIPPLP